eukprot:TRINITY_DN16426_c0_g1_i1.p1 TRINITY_DN16426_c0_g1~~TRINITY_DN16426_c0_g1_i1.p1  ORF type:complete len:345 (+),score=49.48 TRINITY_DN16426_c0_g1_i1:165-1199(+)
MARQRPGFIRNITVVLLLVVIWCFWRSSPAPHSAAHTLPRGSDPAQTNPSPQHEYTSRHPSEARKTGSKMLVVLIGNLRGGELTWQALIKNLIEPNSADLALVVSEDTPQTGVLFRQAQYVWTHEEYADWSVALDNLGGDGSWRQIADQHKNQGMFAPRKEDPKGSGLIVFTLKDLARRKINALGLRKVYDLFVVTRADQFFRCPFRANDYDTSRVWAPKGENYGGVCDRFVMSPAHDIDNVLNILEPFVLEPMRYSNISHFNCEKLYLKNLKDRGLMPIGRFPRMMYTASTVGDPTRWSKGDKKKPSSDGVLIKYPSEYPMVNRTCFLHDRREQRMRRMDRPT